MSFRINTNISAMNAQVSANANNRELSNSLARLSSGLRINSSADDAAGMSIADSLRSQANTLGQAIKNGNDAIGIVQTADKAMDEQVKILDTIKTKAAQSAQDGQSSASRAALQQDITKLMEELDNIANTTSYNGINLLSGSFTNKQFQVGAYSRETINVSIGDTTSAKIGSTRFETTKTISGTADLSGTKILVVTNGVTTSISGVKISTSAGTGLGALAESINRFTDTTGITATATVQHTASAAVAAGNVTGLVLNGITLGDVKDVKSNDSDGKLVNTINASTSLTGVVASIDEQGRLNLTSVDGRGIVASGTISNAVNKSSVSDMGRLTLSRAGSSDIVMSSGTTTQLFSANNEATINLRNVAGVINSTKAQAIGGFANSVQSSGSNATIGLGVGVTSRAGAMMVMDIASTAIAQLDKIRANLGSTQNELTSTINNISVTQVNVTAAESQIRDVDFAQESANFSKRNILAQSGSYAMSQANAVQQNVLRLLQ
jgi:flagellin